MGSHSLCANVQGALLQGLGGQIINGLGTLVENSLDAKIVRWAHWAVVLKSAALELLMSAVRSLFSHPLLLWGMRCLLTIVLGMRLPLHQEAKQEIPVVRR